MASASAANAFGQESAAASGFPVCSARLAQKFFRCLSSVIFSSGANPAISMNVQRLRAANSSIRRLLPIRRRPEQTTSDAEGLAQSPSSHSNSSSRPMNGFASFFMGRESSGPRFARQG